MITGHTNLYHTQVVTSNPFYGRLENATAVFINDIYFCVTAVRPAVTTGTVRHNPFLAQHHARVYRQRSNRIHQRQIVELPLRHPIFVFTDIRGKDTAMIEKSKALLLKEWQVKP